METLAQTTIPPEVAADHQAVIDHVVTGQPLDPEIARRVAERAASVRQEIEKQGVQNLGTQIIREMRGALDDEQERELTLTQRDLVRTSEGPVRLLDPDTDETYVLLREDDYERLRSGAR